MQKRLFSIFLVIAISCSLFVSTASAVDFKEGYYENSDLALDVPSIAVEDAVVLPGVYIGEDTLAVAPSISPLWNFDATGLESFVVSGTLDASNSYDRYFFTTSGARLVSFYLQSSQSTDIISLWSSTDGVTYTLKNSGYYAGGMVSFVVSSTTPYQMIQVEKNSTAAISNYIVAMNSTITCSNTDRSIYQSSFPTIYVYWMSSYWDDALVLRGINLDALYYNNKYVVDLYSSYSQSSLNFLQEFYFSHGGSYLSQKIDLSDVKSGGIRGAGVYTYHGGPTDYQKHSDNVVFIEMAPGALYTVFWSEYMTGGNYVQRWYDYRYLNTPRRTDLYDMQENLLVFDLNTGRVIDVLGLMNPWYLLGTKVPVYFPKP